MAVDGGEGNYIFGNGLYQGLDNDGNILALGSLTVTYTDTGLSADTFQDSLLTVPNTNPIVLSASGKANVFFADGNYDIVVKDSEGLVIRTITNFIQNECQLAAFNASQSAQETQGYVEEVQGYVEDVEASVVDAQGIVDQGIVDITAIKDDAQDFANDSRDSAIDSANSASDARSAQNGAIEAQKECQAIADFPSMNTSGAGGGSIYVSNASISEDVTITESQNAMSIGDVITIQDGVTVTVNGSWKII